MKLELEQPSRERVYDKATAPSTDVDAYVTHCGCLVTEERRRSASFGHDELEITLSTPAAPMRRNVSRDFLTGSAD